MQRILVVVAGIALVFTVATRSHATLNACSAAKKKCVAKKTAALLKCHVHSETPGMSPDPAVRDQCLQTAREKFDGGPDPSRGCFAKLEAKFSGSCLTVGDTTPLENKADAFVTDVVTELDPSYPLVVQNECAARKKKCVSKKTVALLKCQAKNEKPPGIPPEILARCLQKAKDKFDGGAVPSKGCFARLEAEFPFCQTTGDTVSLENKVDAFVNDVVCELDPSDCVPQPTPTPTPVPTSTCPGPTPTANPNHACCVIPAVACYNVPEVPGQECGMFGGSLVPGGFCACGDCVVP